MNIFRGLLSIAIGLFTLFSVVVSDAGSSLRAGDEVFDRYVVIALCDLGGMMVVFGVLALIGKMNTDKAFDGDVYEKSKIGLTLVVLSLPFWIVCSIAIYYFSQNFIWIVAWSLILIYLLRSAYFDFKNIFLK